MNRRAERLLRTGCLLGGGVAALVLFCFDPERAPFYPVCTFHQLTGLDCPGCGSLRAMHQLLHGHVAAALHFNALAVLSLPFFGCLLFRFLRRRKEGGDGVVVRAVWLWVYLVAWVAFGILRDLPVSFLAWFAP